MIKEKPTKKLNFLGGMKEKILDIYNKKDIKEILNKDYKIPFRVKNEINFLHGLGISTYELLFLLNLKLKHEGIYQETNYF